MASLRRLFWLFVALAGAGVVLGSLFYFRLASEVPDFETSSLVLARIGRSVDALRERQQHETGKPGAPFAVVADEALEAPVGQLFLAELRCPDYLARAGDVGIASYYREAIAPSPTGAARCASRMAEELATRLLLPSHAHEILAGARLLSALGGRELFSLWLSARAFQPGGPIGLDEAAKALFHSSPQSLDWERASELVIASEYWDVVAYCKNPPYLKDLRDHFLARAGELLPAKAEPLRAAAAAPTSCEQPRSARK